MTKIFYLNFLTEAFRVENYHSWQFADDYNSYEYKKERINISIEPSFFADIIQIKDGDNIVYKNKVYNWFGTNCTSIKDIKTIVYTDYISDSYKNYLSE